MNDIDLSRAARLFADYVFGDEPDPTDKVTWLARTMFLYPAAALDNAYIAVRHAARALADRALVAFQAHLKRPEEWTATPHTRLPAERAAAIQEAFVQLLRPTRPVTMSVTLRLDVALPPGTTLDKARIVQIQQAIRAAFRDAGMPALQQALATAGVVPVILRLPDRTAPRD